jgi:digeranylgeranylglycerophospholipid reductase
VVEKRNLYDTVVVGAGPVGSHVAGRLAGLGHRVVVLEQHDRVGKLACCTGIVGRECLEAFPVAMEAVLRESRSARFFPPSAEPFSVEKETAQAYILNRPAFDAAMARSAAESGAECRLGSRVVDIAAAGDSLRVGFETGERAADLQAKAVVIASGFGSKLPRRLGLGRTGDFVMGAQAEVNAPGLDQVEVHFGGQVAPGFFAWLVPTASGRALAGLLSRNHTGSRLQGFLNHLAAQGRIDSPQARIVHGGVPLRPLPRTSAARVVVIGDAAGQVKPTTGGGIYYGLLCAEIAADVLHRAIAANDLSAGVLREYDRRWRRLLSRELQIGRWSRWLLERLNDRQVDRLFQMVQEESFREALLSSPDFSFDWHSRLVLRGLRRLGPRAVLPMLRLAAFPPGGRR